MDEAHVEYGYDSADAPDISKDYLMPPILRLLGAAPGKRVFELGCGNGVNARELMKHGYEVVAVDTSTSGIAQARSAAPEGQFFVGSAYDDLAAQYGQFDAVVSLEVVEHLYSPAAYAQTVAALLRPGGVAIVSTPYHGYLKNLAMALAGAFPQHFGPLWEGGHIKFWHHEQLVELFAKAGLSEIAYQRVGRIPPLAKSMVCSFRKG